MDPRRPELYWFMVCKPNCELNAVRHASFQFEEVATARSYGDLEVRRAVIKLGRDRVSCNLVGAEQIAGNSQPLAGLASLCLAFSEVD